MLYPKLIDFSFTTALAQGLVYLLPNLPNSANAIYNHHIIVLLFRLPSIKSP